MGDKIRNCNTCAYFPCNYYNQFNIDRNIGCIDWTDEIKQNYISNQTVEYIKPTIASDTSCDHANLSDGTHIIDSRKEK